MMSSPPCSFLDVYLAQGAYVIISNSINVLWQDQLEAEFTIPQGTPLGYYDVYQGSGHYDWWTGNCISMGQWVLASGFRVIGTTAVTDAISIEHTATVFPNPFIDNATLSFSNVETKKHKLIVTDSFGNEILSETINGGQVTINRKNFAAGIYFYHLEGIENKSSFNGRFAVMD